MSFLRRTLAMLLGFAVVQGKRRQAKYANLDAASVAASQGEVAEDAQTDREHETSLAESDASARDPLVDFIGSLEAHLEDVNQSQTGITFVIEDLVCNQFSINRILTRTEVPGRTILDDRTRQMTLTLLGLGAKCHFKYRYWALHLLPGSGDLTAEIDPSSMISAMLTIPLDANKVPEGAKVSLCDADLKLQVKFTNSLIGPILNLFRGWIASAITTQAKQKVCDQLRDLATENITNVIDSVNVRMLPEDKAANSARRLAKKAAAERNAATALNLATLDADEQIFLSDETPEIPAATLEAMKAIDCGSCSLGCLIGGTCFPNAPDGSVATEAACLKVIKEEGIEGRWCPAKSLNKRLVDWTKSVPLEWFNWYMDDVLRSDGMNSAIRWALEGKVVSAKIKAQKNLVIPGFKDPVASDEIETSAGMTLEIDTYITEFVFEGLDSVSNYTAVHAASATELEGDFSLGTEEVPAVGVSVVVSAKIKAHDDTGKKPPSETEINYRLHLALSSPSFGAKVRLPIDLDQLDKEKTVAQLLFAPECSRSLLAEAPSVKNLTVGFKGLKDPLTFTSQTSSQLAGDIAGTLDNAVQLFNSVYEDYLPSAISRFAGSPGGLMTVNGLLAEQLSPQECISEKEAKERAEESGVSTWNEWQSVLGEDVLLRQLVDHLIDGFFENNLTEIRTDAMKNMPAVHIPQFHVGDVELYSALDLNLAGYTLAGLNQISSFRVLTPSADDPKSLSMKVAVKCPTEELHWKPSVAIHGGLTANAVSKVDGEARIEYPCGGFEIQLAVVIDLQRILDLKVPGTPVCLLQAFGELSIKNVKLQWDGDGDVIVQSKDGDVSKPLDEFCESYPKACALVEITKALATADKINSVVDELRESTKAQCLSGFTQSNQQFLNQFLAEHTADEEEKTILQDTMGYSYFKSSPQVALVGATLTLIIAAALGGIAVLRKGTPMDDAAPFCMIAWSPSMHASVAGTVGICVCLAAALVLRILSCFCLLHTEISAYVYVDSLGGKLAKIRALTFTFLGTGKQYLDANMLDSDIAWLGTSMVLPFTLLAVLLLMWSTSFLAARRRMLLRVFIVLGRFAFQDIETYTMTKAAMDNDLTMPLGVMNSIRVDLDMGAHFGLISTFFMMAVPVFFLALTPAVAAPAWKSGNKANIAQDVACAFVLIGGAMWLAYPFVEIENTDLAGTLFKPVRFSGLGLMQHVEDPLLVTAKILVVVLAPLLQVACHVVCRVSPSRASTRTMQILKDVADSFCVIDVFIIAFYVTFRPSIGQFAQAGLDGKFGTICSAVQSNLGMHCLGIKVNTVFWGLFGGFLAAFGAMTFIMIHVAEDAAKVEERDVTSSTLPNFESAESAFDASSPSTS